jgi:transcriptional regulator with XRE-family HTH domain
MPAGRIKLVFEALRFLGIVENQSDFAKALGYGRAYISQVLSGKQEPKDLPNKLYETFGVDIDWFENGSGEMFPTDNMLIKHAMRSLESQQKTAEENFVKEIKNVGEQRERQHLLDNFAPKKRKEFTSNIANILIEIGTNDHAIIMPLVVHNLQQQYIRYYQEKSLEGKYFLASLPKYSIPYHLPLFDDCEYCAFETAINHHEGDGAAYREVTVGTTINRNLWNSPLQVIRNSKEYLLVFKDGVVSAKVILMDETNNTIKFGLVDSYLNMFVEYEHQISDLVQILNIVSVTKFK